MKPIAALAALVSRARVACAGRSAVRLVEHPRGREALRRWDTAIPAGSFWDGIARSRRPGGRATTRKTSNYFSELARMSHAICVGLPAAIPINNNASKQSFLTEPAMKKILATLTILAVTSISASAFASGCGNNAGRNSNTRPTTTSSGQPSGNSTAGAGVRH